MSEIFKKFTKREDIFMYNINDKNNFFSKNLLSLIKFHLKNCKEYKKIFFSLSLKKNIYKIENLPFIPVSFFKKFDLLSVEKSKIIKVLKSSGTTSNLPSKIYLDVENSKNQTWVLSKIVQSILGKKRLPMLVIDKDPKGISREQYNARVAAINGFSIFGRNITFLINEKNEVDEKKFKEFLSLHSNEKFFIFGFTNLIYEYLIKSKKINLTGDLKNAILLHGGGWKKLTDILISNEKFKKILLQKYNLKNIYNYYGLIEQTGSIFIECNKCSLLKCSLYSDVFLRDENLNLITKNKTKGLLQLMSLLPSSYPGNNILTEDIGEIVDVKKCDCGFKGKRFNVHGRTKNSEIRGCANI